mgnify:CR=1 FL=1
MGELVVNALVGFDGGGRWFGSGVAFGGLGVAVELATEFRRFLLAVVHGFSSRTGILPVIFFVRRQAGSLLYFGEPFFDFAFCLLDKGSHGQAVD